MRARNAARTGLTLTREPRVEPGTAPDQADHRRARYVAWGALLVAAAAIAGYVSGPQFSSAPASAPAPHSRPE